MDDLVQRLRLDAGRWVHEADRFASLSWQAADEIERLRAQLAEHDRDAERERIAAFCDEKWAWSGDQIASAIRTKTAVKGG